MRSDVGPRIQPATDEGAAHAGRLGNVADSSQKHVL
jgi:hypothetical protein